MRKRCYCCVSVLQTEDEVVIKNTLEQIQNILNDDYTDDDDDGDDDDECIAWDVARRSESSRGEVVRINVLIIGFCLFRANIFLDFSLFCLDISKVKMVKLDRKENTI